MHINELVLDNFKSFGRKTRIPFYEDFTVITGPNGSGKSNIIDAVLFALGLARTSGIRAEKLTDLIYNPGHEDGSDHHGTREASVTVVLDNEDGTLSRSQVVSAAGTDDVGDVDEIAIRRRVKQTEDNYYSYYYINDRSVNLGDIRDLLSQAGVTPEGYNVVMQGDVTEIINMTSGSRREIIDEIAGVAEFDAKKEDAFEELELVSDRIGEARLRSNEKRQRLDQLEDERETALQFQELREEKETYEGYRKAAELEDKRDELDGVADRIDRIEADLREERTELDRLQGRVDRLDAERQSLNEEIERKGEDEQLAIKGDIEEIKGEIARLEDAIDAQNERLEDAQNDRRQAYVAIDRKEERIEELDAEIRETKVEKSNLTAERAEREEELADVNQRIDEVDEAFQDVKDALAAKREALSAAKDVKNERQREQDRLIDEARRRSTAIRETEEDVEDLEAEIPDLEDELADLATELEKAERNRETITDVVEDLKAEKSRLQDDLDDVEDDISAAQQEYAELEAKADRAGDSSYGRAVTSVLDGGFEGVHGTVGQLGGVDPQYATACETAAGGRLANVVVDDDGVGQRCIDYLKSRSAGRATFLPLTEMHERRLPSLPDGAGVIDFAYELVDFDPEYAGVFAHVLGDTVVVEDLETARAHMGDVRLVTLEGELVEKSGAMTGGSGAGTRYSFSGGEGQLERVARRIEELEAEREELRDELRDVEERLEDARDRQADAADQVRDIEADRERTEDAIADARERIEELEAEIEELEAERDRVSDDVDSVETAIARQERAIAVLEADIDELQAEVADSDLPDLTDRADELEAEIDDLDDRIDDLDAELNELQLERQYADDAIEDLQAEVEDAQNRAADAEEEIGRLEAEIRGCVREKARKERAVADLESQIADLKTTREALRADLDDARRARDDQREVVTERDNDRERAREERERLAWEIQALEEEVEGYDPEEVPDRDELEAEIERLEAEMDELRPVNERAIEAYDEVEAELEDLLERKETLEEEAEAIEERIQSYEQRKKATFMEAFEDIDDHFRDIFSRLSNGTGRLALEDEDDPFDGGLTMEAQPGDKPIQRLAAMSGGEKSLTALAFIFAIQRHNPAPFYALDEIDAFLDAANAERVGEMVDDLAGEAQFVVVSHRSALLDRSERAIGVTMQEDNVSAVTGIDLSGGEEVPADD